MTGSGEHQTLDRAGQLSASLTHVKGNCGRACTLRFSLLMVKQGNKQ